MDDELPLRAVRKRGHFPAENPAAADSASASASVRAARRVPWLADRRDDFHAALGRTSQRQEWGVKAYAAGLGPAAGHGEAGR
jgi:hypothetical protein